MAARFMLPSKRIASISVNALKKEKKNISAYRFSKSRHAAIFEESASKFFWRDAPIILLPKKFKNAPFLGRALIPRHPYFLQIWVIVTNFFALDDPKIEKVGQGQPPHHF